MSDEGERRQVSVVVNIGYLKSLSEAQRIEAETTAVAVLGGLGLWIVSRSMSGLTVKAEKDVVEAAFRTAIVEEIVTMKGGFAGEQDVRCHKFLGSPVVPELLVPYVGTVSISPPGILFS